MKKFICILLMAMLVSIDLPLHGQGKTVTGYHAWWNEGYSFRQEKDPLARKMPLIRVEGNRFVNSAWDTWNPGTSADCAGFLTRNGTPVCFNHGKVMN